MRQNVHATAARTRSATGRGHSVFRHDGRIAPTTAAAKGPRAPRSVQHNCLNTCLRPCLHSSCCVACAGGGPASRHVHAGVTAVWGLQPAHCPTVRSGSSSVGLGHSCSVPLLSLYVHQCKLYWTCSRHAGNGHGLAKARICTYGQFSGPGSGSTHRRRVHPET